MAKGVHGGSLFAGFGLGAGGMGGVLAVDFGSCGGGHFSFSRLDGSRDFLGWVTGGLEVVDNEQKKYFWGT